MKHEGEYFALTSESDSLKHCRILMYRTVECDCYKDFLYAKGH